MNPILIKVDEKTLEKMKKFYDSQMVANQNEDEDILFVAEIIGCTIVAHKSMEITFEGIRASEAASRWSTKPRRAKAKQVEEVSADAPYTKTHIGSDDVGMNDYFGPICTVSCCVKEEDISWLSALGLYDVRSMTANDIVRVAREIKDRITYSLLILDNPHYNRMVSEGSNPAHIKAKLHNQAITNVLQRLEAPVEKKVVEQFVAEKTYYNYLKNEVIVVKGLTFEKNSYAHYIAVGCAHVLAQYACLQYFNNMSRSLKVKLPRGNTTAVDAVGITLVKERGESILNKVAKKNMNCTNRILEAVNR